MIRHYVIIGGVKYTLDIVAEVTPVVLNTHPKDPTFYLLELGETEEGWALLDKLYEVDKSGLYIVPIEDVTTIGAEPITHESWLKAM